MVFRIKKGDLVNVVAPSSYIEDKEQLTKGIEILKNWGLEVNQNNIHLEKHGYFAGDDDFRSKALQKTQNFKITIFSNGGWGSARLLERNIKWSNSWMIGFSDTCSLLLSKYSTGKLGSIHGPMISTLSNEPSWSIDRFKNFLFEGYLDDLKGIPLKKGIASGEIIASNLTICCFLVGTNHLPDLSGKIIIFEDINEDIYKIDRMFTYLRLSNKLKNVAGLGFGHFFNPPKISNREELLRNLIIERFHYLNIPIVFNLPIGHSSGNGIIPLGLNAILNGHNGNLSIH